MKISTRARYGTRLMVYLGLHHGKGQILLREIATNENISEKYLSQIIIPLKAAGLVKSFRGAQGGYILAKPLNQITLKEIVESLEGSFDLVECTKNLANCTRIQKCITRELWMELGETISHTLQNITLFDLVKRCREREESAVMYNI